MSEGTFQSWTMASNGPQDQAIENGRAELREKEYRKPQNASLKLRRHLVQEIPNDHADALLLVCCLISGLVDSTIFNAYGTFVSMQTGNTIFLALGGSTSHTTSQPYGWVKSFTSIVCFASGCFLFTRFSRYMGPLRRITSLASFFFQTIVVFIVAAVIQGGVVNGSLDTISKDINWWELLPIALLSFQAAGQITESRALGVPEIPTVVVTSMIHDFFADPKLAAPLGSNVKRNRRVLAFFSLLVGAVAGGFIAESTHRMQIPLWIAGGLKLVITCAWLIWPVKEDKKEAAV